MNEHSTHPVTVLFLYAMTLPSSPGFLTALNRAKFELLMNVSERGHGDYTSKDGSFLFRFQAPSTYSIFPGEKGTG